MDDVGPAQAASADRVIEKMPRRRDVVTAHGRAHGDDGAEGCEQTTAEPAAPRADHCQRAAPGGSHPALSIVRSRGLAIPYVVGSPRDNQVLRCFGHGAASCTSRARVITMSAMQRTVIALCVAAVGLMAEPAQPAHF